MSALFDWNAIAQASALQVVDCLVEGTLIAIFAGLVLGAARRQNAGARFAVWFSALVAIATLPLVGGLWSSHGTGVSAETAHPAIALPSSWAHYLFGAWAVVAVWLLIGVARGLRHLHVLRKSCIPVDTTELDPLVRDTVERNQSSRSATLCTSDLVRVPTAIGLTKPVIAIPAWVMNELSADELNQILLHELAHLRRWDDWTNLAQKVVEALFFFHPAVWWIEKKVSLEREMACDDAVIAETASPRAYAECLTHLAERTLIQRSMALAQAALGRIRQTSLRVAQILDAKRDPGAGRTWKPAVSLVAGFAIVCMLGISREPKLIAFSDNEPTYEARSTVARSTTSPVGSPDTGSVHLSNAALHGEHVRVVQASLQVRAVRGNSKIYQQATLAASPAARRKTVRLTRQANIRLTGANTVPVAFTETFFVVVEGNGGGPEEPIYQIHLWRVMVFHPLIDDSRVPRKEI
jgi:beta-lactamase regulating signal transducer with metallopeptidase domain